MDRVVITGVGVVSPIGIGREVFWRAALEGRSGAIRVDNPWIADSDVACKIAAPVRDFDPVAAGIPKKDVPILDRATCFALAAAREASADAGFGFAELDEGVRLDGVDPERLAVCVGTGVGGLATLEVMHAIWLSSRTKGSVKRYALPMLIPNAPAAQVAIRFGARGECKTITTACAAGTMAIGDGWRLIAHGDADVVLAGGVEGVAGDEHGIAVVGFDRLKTLSTRNDDPDRASRPFDRDRDGFVLGEGSAILVLERESHAKARGAKVYATLAGYASNCDARSMIQLDDSGERIEALVRAALKRAGRPLSDVEHVSAHGTSTIPNDRTEARALRRMLGHRADDVSVTALKSMTGHAIGGSGPMETAALALALRDGMIAPTINYEHADPDCDVDVVANRPRAQRPGLALKLSYGFGGHNACLVMEPA